MKCISEQTQQYSTTYHLGRCCIPGEVVQPRGGQVVLIVLWKLLELVLMREACIYTEIPVESQLCD